MGAWGWGGKGGGGGGEREEGGEVLGRVWLLCVLLVYGHCRL